MTGMVNGLKKSLVTGRGEWFQSVFLASKILHGARSPFESLIISRATMLFPMDRRMGSLACVPAGGATYSIRRIFVSRGKDFGGMH